MANIYPIPPNQIFYLVQQAPLPPRPEPSPTLLEKIKEVAGTALAILGLAILVGAAIALAGYFSGHLAITSEAIHPFFTTGVACSVAGFHLAKGGSAVVEASAGPITFST